MEHAQNPTSAEDDQNLWEIGVFDAHCHPTDIMTSVERISNMKANVLTIMSTRAQDQDLVADAAATYPLHKKSDLRDSGSTYVVPAFGWHPWFSHQIRDDRNQAATSNSTEHYQSVLTPVPEDDFVKSLPPYQSLTDFLHKTEARLQEHPLALVGEVGLDRTFRLPVGSFHAPGDTSRKTNEHPDGEYTPGSREGRPLSPYRVSMDHQRNVLKAQLELAAKHRRAVSVHSVQAHGVVFEVLQSMWKGHEKISKRQQKRRQSVSDAHDSDDDLDPENTSPLPYPPRICMHSYSGPVDPLKQFLHSSIPAEVYFSFSNVINFGSASSKKVVGVIQAVPDDRVLIESDFHCAGEKMDELLIDIVRRVCEIKGWEVKAGARQLKENWERFIFGA